MTMVISGKCWRFLGMGMVNENGLLEPFNNFWYLSRYGKFRENGLKYRNEKENESRGEDL